MKNKLQSAILSLCVYASSAQAQTAVQQNHAATPIEIRTVPESAAINMPASEVLDSVRYIPLQTTKESTFGVVSQLIVSEDYYIILDAVTTNSIFLFDKKGAFYKKIDKYNNKPFSSLYNVHHNPIQKTLIIKGRVSGEIVSTFQFDYEGNQLPSIMKPFDDIYFFPNQKIVTSHSLESPYGLHITDTAGTILSQLLPSNAGKMAEREILSPSEAFFYDSDTSVFFTKPYDYNVYRLSQTNQLTTAYQFIFPASNSLPADFIQNDAYYNKRTEIANAKISQTHFFFRSGKMMAFDLAGSDFSLLAYDTESGMLYAVEKLEPDQASYFLPVVTQLNYTMHNNAVYATISSADMFKAAEQITDKRAWLNRLNPALKAYFEKGNKDLNPVISVLYFK